MISKSAIIDRDAKIGHHVFIGAYSIIGSGVEIGDNTWIGPHVVISGPTRIGENNKIFQFASIGEAPQDKSYNGEPTRLEIGDGNTIREYCTLSRGTAKDKKVTRVGCDNWLMANTHIAHDCKVGDHNVFANNTALAGHVTIGNHITLGGFTGIHQFCRIGDYCFLGRAALISKDVPPYLLAAGCEGRRTQVFGLNLVGLKRHHFPPETILALKRAYRILYRKKLSLEQALLSLEELCHDSSHVKYFLKFVRQSKRGILN
ncbi:MAG: acyl-ACP--UDP-N-acetylglucosamine O-acyltransferase [Gammaproteobacteria bacterium]|nr:acyl-ACP--UDP-N-acetylglucosamine O-acyltransferase [Gammaproteobacteria bacterium]